MLPFKNDSVVQSIILFTFLVQMSMGHTEQQTQTRGHSIIERQNILAEHMLVFSEHFDYLEDLLMHARNLTVRFEDLNALTNLQLSAKTNKVSTKCKHLNHTQAGENAASFYSSWLMLVSVLALSIGIMIDDPIDRMKATFTQLLNN